MNTEEIKQIIFECNENILKEFKEIEYIPIIGWIITKYQKNNINCTPIYSYFKVSDAQFSGGNDIDAEEIINIIPSAPGTFEVKGWLKISEYDSTQISLGIQHPGIIINWKEKLKTLQERYNELILNKNK